MNKLPVLSGREIVKALSKAGFNISRQRGSHLLMIKFVKDSKLIVVIPMHREVDPGTLLSIIAQASMTREEFLKLL